MLKIEVNRDEGEMMVQVRGNLPEVISDLGAVIHSIHVKACSDDLFVGREFERIFRDPEFWDDVFEPKKHDAEILAASKNLGKGGSE